jgi:Thermophilic metalloprotease (M29)
MSQADFLDLSRSEIVDGSWFEKLHSAWSAGRIGLIRVAAEPSGDPELRAAVETMIDSNGSYRAGDRAVIHTRPSALSMGCETAHLLQERGIESTVVFGMSSLASEMRRLLKVVYGTGFDPGGADLSALEGIANCYGKLLMPIEADGKGHWIVPIGTAPDPDPEDVPALNLFTKIASQGLAPIGLLRNDGRILSHDIWLTPTELDIQRLNADLPKDQHWTMAEWRSQVFRSMAVSSDDLQRLALEIEGVRLTIEASLHGGVLRYQRNDGTDFSYRVEGRPVILDCGRVGDNSLGGTESFSSVITNQPTTEVFVAPLEDSLTGVMVYTVPERTVHGVIHAPYRIEVKDGRVIDTQAPDQESGKILRHYCGLEQYDASRPGGDEKVAFEMSRIIAEMAIAGFNPVQVPEIQNGRLRPVTGLVLLDEKLGDHQAFGSNDQFKGKTPSSIGNHHVNHTDFVGTIDRTITLEK